MEEPSVRMYDEAPVAGPSSFIVETSLRLIAGIMLVGAAVGLLVIGLGLALREFIVSPLLCQSIDAFALCGNETIVSVNIATVLLAIAGTITLVKLSVYRPLMITIAAAASMWGVGSWLGGMTWFEMAVWTTAVYAFAYGVYAWLLRIYSFPVALALVIALVIASRVVLQW